MANSKLSNRLKRKDKSQLLIRWKKKQKKKLTKQVASLERNAHDQPINYILENLCRSLIAAITPRLQHSVRLNGCHCILWCASCAYIYIYTYIVSSMKSYSARSFFYYSGVQPASFLTVFSSLNRVLGFPWHVSTNANERAHCAHVLIRLALAVRKVSFVTNGKEMKNLRWKNVL